jgi:hypothetical protein
MCHFVRSLRNIGLGCPRQVTTMPAGSVQTAIIDVLEQRGPLDDDEVSMSCGGVGDRGGMHAAVVPGDPAAAG